jgi:hypothetical protein
MHRQQRPFRLTSCPSSRAACAWRRPAQPRAAACSRLTATSCWTVSSGPVTWLWNRTRCVAACKLGDGASSTHNSLRFCMT